MQVNTLLAKVQFLSHWEWVQTEVKALKVLLPKLTINTLASMTKAQPPVVAKAVARSKFTVTVLLVTVIPFPDAGGLLVPPPGLGSSDEQPVKKATPNKDMAATAPDFLMKSLLAEDNSPVLTSMSVFIKLWNWDWILVLNQLVNDKHKQLLFKKRESENLEKTHKGDR